MFKKPLSKTQIIYYTISSISVLLFILFFCFYQNQNLDLQKQQFENQKKLSEVQQEMQKEQLGMQKKQLEMQQLEMMQKKTEIGEEDSNFTPSDIQKFLSFEDLIGFSEEKEALDGFIHYIKNPKNYQNIGKVEPPLGILLYGIAGTGKTTLARAVAQETKLPFFEVASSVFSQKYVGTAPEMVRNLFENARKEAKKNRGAIIFLDECDTIFTNLENLEEGKEIANIVNQFKTELTSMLNNPDKPIFVIGATNHYQKIDEAIKSRFTYHIEIKAGNQADREAFLKFMIDRRKNPYSDEAKTFLLEDINKRLDKFQNDQEYLKTNRTLENLLKTTVSVFARNRNLRKKTYENLRSEIDKEDIEKAYQIVIGKKYS